jgi:hypothetical protein
MITREATNDCQPPELEIRDIGDLTMEQFRGIFRFTYSGDAHLVLRTKVQVRSLALHANVSYSNDTHTLRPIRLTISNPTSTLWVALGACLPLNNRL